VVGAGLAAGWIGTWAHLTLGLGQEQQYRDCRRAVFRQRGPGVNVCENIDNDPASAAQSVVNRARSICADADVLEPLQFVFGIGAAAAAGVGIYFLVSALTGESPSEQALQLRPSIGPDHAYLGVAASF